MAFSSVSLKNGHCNQKNGYNHDTMSHRISDHRRHSRNCWYQQNALHWTISTELKPSISQKRSTYVSVALSVGRPWYKRDLKAHFGCVNALENSRDEERFASGGDDCRVLLWNLTKSLSTSSTTDVPVQMDLKHNSNIFCLEFSTTDERLLSGGNDGSVIVHDAHSGRGIDTFLMGCPVYCLSADPVNESIFSAACHDGRALLTDTRSSEDPFCITDSRHAMHSVCFNPVATQYLATTTCKSTAQLWDLRCCSKPVLFYKKPPEVPSYDGMSLMFNDSGERMFMIGRRGPPVLYSTYSASPLHQFDHKGYYNACTIKSCCFAGPRDEFVVAGSDSNDLFVWRIPGEISADTHYVHEACTILKGHRSVVNQVRYNKRSSIMLSSGVEKSIKAWSPFPIADQPNQSEDRCIFQQRDYISLLQDQPREGHPPDSVDEDSYMLAFFDSLIQRDLEDSSSSDSDSCDGDDDRVMSHSGFSVTDNSSSTSLSSDSNVNTESGGDINETSDSTSDEDDDDEPFNAAFISALVHEHGASNSSDVSPAPTMSELIVARKKRDAEKLLKANHNSCGTSDESLRGKRFLNKRQQIKYEKHKLKRILARIGSERIAQQESDEDDGRIILPGEDGHSPAADSREISPLTIPNRDRDLPTQERLARLRRIKLDQTDDTLFNKRDSVALSTAAQKDLNHSSTEETGNNDQSTRQTNDQPSCSAITPSHDSKQTFPTTQAYKYGQNKSKSDDDGD